MIRTLFVVAVVVALFRSLSEGDYGQALVMLVLLVLGLRWLIRGLSS
jgi:hypothetical protein